MYHVMLDISVVSHFCRTKSSRRPPNGTSAIPYHLYSPSQQLGYSFYYSQFQVNMLRNALRQSGRAVGAVSASSRAATVSLTNLGQNLKKVSLYRIPF